MRKFPSYFIMDFVYDKIRNIKVYEVIATVLFEASVFLNEINHSIIHMIAVEPGYESKQHIELLLCYICRQTMLAKKDCFLLTQFGKYPYTGKIEIMTEIPH